MSRTTSAICLQGTVPMYYKGNRYNIPVNIWVMEDYPYRPPMPYVTPTESMLTLSLAAAVAVAAADDVMMKCVH